MTVTTVIFDRVHSHDSRFGLGLDPGLKSYQAALWGGFAFGIVGGLYFFFLPYVGAYCRGSLSFSLGSRYFGCHRFFETGRCSWQNIGSRRIVRMIFCTSSALECIHQALPPASRVENRIQESLKGATRRYREPSGRGPFPQPWMLPK